MREIEIILQCENDLGLEFSSEATFLYYEHRPESMEIQLENFIAGVKEGLGETTPGDGMSIKINSYEIKK